MKIAVFFILVIAIIPFNTGYAQVSDTSKLDELNDQMIAAFKSGDLDAAEKIGIDALAVSVETRGAESAEAAASYSNLGVIYKDKDKYSISAENFEKAIIIYQKLDRKSDLAKIYELLGLVNYRDGNKKEAEINYKKSLELFDSEYGKDNMESFDAALSLANFYAFQKKYEESDDYFIRAYSAVKKNFGTDEEKFERISESRTCARLYITDRDQKKYKESYDQKYEELFGPGKKDEDVVNGKAISLPKPIYPDEARRKGISGRVIVSVEIDEKGSVSKARLMCGNPMLGETSQAAARLAKFGPTLLKGMPVSVKGMIVYNFQR